MANSTNSPWSAGWQLLLLSPEPGPGTSGKQNQQGTKASSISPRTITEYTEEDRRLTRQTYCRLAKENKIPPSFLTFQTGGKTKKKSLSYVFFFKPAAKQGLQPHTPRERYHSRNHSCIVSISGGGKSPYATATINQETTDNQATNSLQHPHKYSAQTVSCCWSSHFCTLNPHCVDERTRGVIPSIMHC